MIEIKGIVGQMDCSRDERNERPENVPRSREVMLFEGIFQVKQATTMKLEQEMMSDGRKKEMRN